ncbi:hemerythrin domain-containing protein [Variovorax sp. J22R133]|uniref:hemerythrin domain-containing protein n=1 Tax=Variovorax brevis TaxID=3053503 RepID=UPI0025771221|nr:hemerythrin domain-containing protein [Variovorax sp. J22R133]MDM0116597.1 hemerythrin domain-containing protein [Variovorax sp. J22R133]
MLAAESARAVLCAEHARIRELLAAVDKAASSGGCANAIQAGALLELVERLQHFDEATHRPKGVMLLSVLRGRSIEADGLLQRLVTMRERGDRLLSRVLPKLRAAAAGNVGAAVGVEGLLEEHRTLTIAHLNAEDSFLHWESTAHLTRDEWAAIASSISSAMALMKK